MLPGGSRLSESENVVQSDEFGRMSAGMGGFGEELPADSGKCACRRLGGS